MSVQEGKKSRSRSRSRRKRNWEGRLQQATPTAATNKLNKNLRGPLFVPFGKKEMNDLWAKGQLRTLRRSCVLLAVIGEGLEAGSCMIVVECAPMQVYSVFTVLHVLCFLLASNPFCTNLFTQPAFSLRRINQISK